MSPYDEMRACIRASLDKRNLPHRGILTDDLLDRYIADAVAECLHREGDRYVASPRGVEYVATRAILRAFCDGPGVITFHTGTSPEARAQRARSPLDDALGGG